MKRLLLLCLLAACLASPLTASAATCDATLQGLFDWLKAPHPGTTRALSATVTSLNAADTSTYFEANLNDFQPAGCFASGQLLACSGDRVNTSQAAAVYGNWSCITQSSGGGFPSCINPFNNGPDRYRVSLSMPYGPTAQGSLRFTAQTAGVTTKTIPLSNLTCNNGVIYGVSTGTGPTSFLIQLSRSEWAIPQ